MCRHNQLLSVLLLLLCVAIAGCVQQPINETLFFSYNQTILGQSSSGDVLNYVDMSLTTLISQSDTVVASWGEDKKGYREWLNLVAFDENSADAVRKYFFFVDEKARRIPFVHPKWSARLDGQLILDKAVLEKSYADERMRSIAILQEIQKRFAADISKVSAENKKLSMCQLVVNESFEEALRQLSESPDWATQFDTPQGWEFDSRNFFTGILHLHEEGGIATIKMQLGAIPWVRSKSEPGRPDDPNFAP